MKIKNLKEIKLGTGMIVFILFFGIAFLEAFRTQDWKAVAYWFGIASLFLFMDDWTKEQGKKEK